MLVASGRNLVVAFEPAAYSSREGTPRAALSSAPERNRRFLHGSLLIANCETRPLVDRSVVVMVGPKDLLSIDRGYAQAVAAGPAEGSALTRREVCSRRSEETPLSP